MGGIEEALARRARATLGHWQLPDQEPQLIKYRENAVFRVGLEDGSAAALRLHRPGYHGQDALASELAWMADLRRSGVSVPEPIPTMAGALLKLHRLGITTQAILAPREAHVTSPVGWTGHGVACRCPWRLLAPWRLRECAGTGRYTSRDVAGRERGGATGR